MCPFKQQSERVQRGNAPDGLYNRNILGVLVTISIHSGVVAPCILYRIVANGRNSINTITAHINLIKLTTVVATIYNI